MCPTTLAPNPRRRSAVAEPSLPAHVCAGERRAGRRPAGCLAEPAWRWPPGTLSPLPRGTCLYLRPERGPPSDRLDTGSKCCFTSPVLSWMMPLFTTPFSRPLQPRAPSHLTNLPGTVLRTCHPHRAPSRKPAWHGVGDMPSSPSACYMGSCSSLGESHGEEKLFQSMCGFNPNDSVGLSSSLSFQPPFTEPFVRPILRTRVGDPFRNPWIWRPHFPPCLLSLPRIICLGLRPLIHKMSLKVTSQGQDFPSQCLPWGGV